MPFGLNPTYANQLLGTIGGTTFTPPAATWAELHIGDPGVTGSSNISSTTTREQITWGAPSAGTLNISNTPTWPSWAGTSPETIIGISVWTLVTAGVFIFSFQLSSNITVQTGFPLSLSSEVVTIGPLAS